MSDISAIDYTPLDADQNVFQAVYKQHPVVNTVVFASSALLCVLAWFVVRTFVAGWIGFALIFVRLTYLSSQMKALKNRSWEEFALANGWQFDAEYSPEAMIPLSLQFGRNQSFSPVIVAQLGGVNAEVYAYETITGGGKSQQTWDFSVARVALPAALPHIMLRARKGLGQEVRQDFADHESLQLEGNFQDYFSLQIEKGQELNVLEIITPDVMQTIVDLSQTEDIEILGNELFFIQSGDARTPEPVRQLVQSVSGVSAQILEQVAHTAVRGVAQQEVKAPETVAAVG